jgi:hypothetical protein
MRHDHAVFLDDGSPIGDQVQVQGSRRVGNVPKAAEPGFDVVHSREDLF